MCVGSAGIGSSPFRSWAMIVLSLSGLLNAVGAWGAESCILPKGSLMLTVNVPRYLSVNPKAANGTVVYTGTVSAPSGYGVVCDNSQSAQYLMGAKNLVGPQAVNTSLPPTYRIKGTGLGFRWRMLADPSLTTPAGQFASTNYYVPALFTAEGAWRAWNAKVNGGQRFQLVKIGSVAVGQVVPGGAIADFVTGNTGTVLIEELSLSQDIHINQPTCTTHDVVVDMGQHNSGFAGPNTRLTPVHASIALDECPAEVNSVSYRLDPTGPYDGASSLVQLSNDSTATGVAVQILDSNSSPLPLGQDIQFADYYPGGGSFRIPFNVAYYQVDNTVQGGTANASLTFTLTYQ